MTEQRSQSQLGYRRGNADDRDRASVRVRRLTAATGVAALTGAGALSLALAASTGATATSAGSTAQQSATATTTAGASSARSSTVTSAPATTTQQAVTHSGGS